MIATAKRLPAGLRSTRFRSEPWDVDAGSRDCAYGTHAPPLCGSGSPAPRLPRFAGVGEPPDRSHKTLTSFGATSNRGLTAGVWPGSSSTGRGRARLNRHDDLDAGRLDPEKRHTRSRRRHSPAVAHRNLDTTPGQINRGRTNALRQGTMRPRKPFPGRRPSTLVLAVLGR